MEGETTGEAGGDAMLFPVTVGEKLREARIAQGLELAQIAATTRIPQRHLEAIEASDFSRLPSITYAMGFSRAFARAVGIDDAAIARDLRTELGAAEPARQPARESYIAADDPAREPPGWLGWAGGLIALVLLAGVGIWYGTSWLNGDQPDAPPPVEPTPVAAAPSPTPAAPASGQVTLTATDQVWVRIYDAERRTLFEKTMAAGERYDVPPAANRPMINLGRPDKIAVTVKGSAVPALGPAQPAIRDVEISADALLARDPAGGNAAAPAP